MSGSRRKQNSKWDLKEESQLPYEKVRDSARPGKTGTSFYERESRSGRFGPRVAGYNNGHKWSAREADGNPSSRHDLQFPSRETLPGSRGSRKDDRIDDYQENFKSTTKWDEDENCDMKMSPGLDDWRQQIPRHSPRNDRNEHRRSRSRSSSRSRSGSRSWNPSRSPVHELRRESVVYGRNRGRPGVAVQLCKDFAAGRCKRGSHCHFSHHSKSYEDNWDNRHKQAGAPKYSTPHESREYPMRSGRNREKSLDRGGEHESRKSGNIPCKFFAAGNCRSGKYCRFSHSGHQPVVSPNRRSRDDSLVRGHNSDDLEKLWHGPKWSDAATFSDAAKPSEDKNERIGTNRKSRDDRLVRNHDSDDVEKLWDGPTWSVRDVSADASNLSDNQNARMGAPGTRFAAWSTDDRLPHMLDENTTRSKITAVSHGGGESNKMEVCNVKNAGAVMGAPESGGTENWLGDMEMSPEWNYPVKPSCSAMNEDHGHITRSSQSLPISGSSLLCEQGIIREASSLLRDATATTEPMMLDESYLKRDINHKDSGNVRVPDADKNAVGETFIPHIDLNLSANILPTQSFDQNGQSSSALPFSSLNSIGQNQGVISSEPSRGGNVNNPQNLSVFSVEKTINKPGTGDWSSLQFGSEIHPAQNTVSSEQLNQLTNLSASLAQFLGDGQQLPQLYAALNSHNVMQVPSSSNAEGSAPDSAVTSQPNEAVRSQNQYDPLSDSIEPEKHDIVNPSGVSINPAGQKSNADGKPNSGSENRKVTEISGMEAEEDKQAQVEDKIPQENGEVPKTDGDDKDDKADEGKKCKDTKGVRAFKFALAEFVKELLKPTWKEGQINKDVYKNVVKKVVDKVIGTMQGAANIPQTQEKIDQYLSFSKPKLTKLVQAYVEKLKKG